MNPQSIGKSPIEATKRYQLNRQCEWDLEILPRNDTEASFESYWQSYFGWNTFARQLQLKQSLCCRLMLQKILASSHIWASNSLFCGEPCTPISNLLNFL